MKTKLIALTGALALSLVPLAIVNAEDSPGHGHHGFREHGPHHMMLEHLGKDLNLSADQQAKVQPIVDQTRPQIRAIHEEAMQKTKAVMDNAMAQIRPLLTAEQQQKLDAMQKAQEDMRNAHKEMEDARAR